MISESLNVSDDADHISHFYSEVWMAFAVVIVHRALRCYQGKKKKRDLQRCFPWKKRKTVVIM